MKHAIKLKLTAGGVGTLISYMSAIMHNGDPVELHTDRTLIVTLKELFKIPDSKLKIIPIDSNGLSDGTTEISDISKIFSQYFEVEVLHAFGKDFQVPYQRGGKPLIGLACYQDHEHLVNFKANDTTWPNCRYYSLDDYARIVTFIKRMGYEVITLDDRRISLEQKAYLLNEMCSAVIGYEGGMHHLAHLLKVPSIILPWSQEFEIIDHRHMYKHILHLDKRTYFARSVDEIVAWTPDEFQGLLQHLKDGHGNNIFLFDGDTPDNTNNILVANDLSMVAVKVASGPWAGTCKHKLPLKSWDREFILEHQMHNPRMLKNPVTFVDPAVINDIPLTNDSDSIG